ncbi:MAG: hypothetical protein GWN61_03150 [candidate division Zixibacteria bacterium]|nr:hypothetical protein [candidate division Zixibacteria bacterium]NIS45047.1 hypothetical protein [candidate division Zixibacteria bacterium]NIU13157.1 hypothetical protein [candidate division Zixibacteria bacterium]NIV05205.1 hypothetical protein [candidate division Zixibacteria bacterium]NIW43929.1 hypothetical protein [Gammaproteobacteria bacterium]
MDNLAIGLGIGFVIGIPLSFVIRQVRAPMEYPAGSRIQLVIAIFVFMISLIGTILLFTIEMQSWIHILIGFIPALPALFLMYTVGKMITSLDELQRKIQTESIAIALAGIFVVATIYGLLGLVGVPQLNWMFVPIVIGIFMLIGKLWTMWKYR